jgi:hypothetical protein
MKKDFHNTTSRTATSHSASLRNTASQNTSDLATILKELFPQCLFKNIKTNAGGFWKPYLLASAALLWMICGESTIVIAFQSAFDILLAVFPGLEKSQASYQGFTGQLAKYQKQLMQVIIPHLRDLTKSKLEKSWRIGKWIVIAADGSRESLARNKDLQRNFAPSKKKRKKRSKRWRKKHVANKEKKQKQTKKDREKKAATPLIWLTLFWHVGTGLPWDWRFGRSDSSERAHATDMAKELPQDALLTADAGFIGYDFWKSLFDADVHFLIRVGGNVRLLTELGYAQETKETVYLWPDYIASQSRPPLVLRLIKVTNDGKTIYLATNTKANDLSDQEAAEIYRRRWGIEVFFRTFKQTFEKGKLKCTGSTNVALELEWSLIGLWVMCLYGKEEIGRRYEVSRLSPAKAIRAFAKTCREFRSDPKDELHCLHRLLGEALKDEYERKKPKTNKEYPRQSKRTPTGEPKLETATKKQRKNAKQLKINKQKLLTA